LLRFGRLLAADSPDALRAQSGQQDFEQAFLYFAQQAEMAEAGKPTPAAEKEA
jgi:hypothetical protein